MSAPNYATPLFDVYEAILKWGWRICWTEVEDDILYIHVAGTFPKTGEYSSQTLEFDLS